MEKQSGREFASADDDARGLNQHIENLALGVDCSPQVCHRSSDRLRRDAKSGAASGGACAVALQ